MLKQFLPTIKAWRFFIKIVLFSGDFVLSGAAFLFAFYSRFHWDFFLKIFPATKGIPDFSLYWPLFYSAIVVCLSVFLISGFYFRINLTFLDEFLRSLRGVMTVWVIIMAGTFLYRGTEYSRLVLVLTAFYMLLFTLMYRQIVLSISKRVVSNLWDSHQVLVLGSGRISESIQRVLQQHPEYTYKVESVQNPKELEIFLHRNKIREIFVGEPEFDHSILIAMSDVCEDYGVPFRIIPDVLELRMGEVILDDSLGIPTYRIRPVTLHGWTFFYKRLFDMLCSICILSVFFFPLVFISIMIKLDSRGPFLLKQPRMGHRRKQFPFYKFRTMIENADDFLEELKQKNDRGGPVFKMKNDPRITRVGKWLRRLSLDEIPQLFNVLRGEMSLIGPRPQVLWEAAAYDDWAKKRLNVLPGITGLWQVSGRAHLSYDQMIDLDIYYIEHWSPGLDLKILLKTIPTVLGAHGAY